MYDVPSDEVHAIHLAAMDAENRRRRLGSDAPGLGAQVHIGQVPYGASPGKGDLAGAMPAAGEGYDTEAPAAYQRKSYGAATPSYADGLVGGTGYGPGGVTGYAARSSRVVTDGETVWYASDGPAGFGIVSPDLAGTPKRSLRARLFPARSDLGPASPGSGYGYQPSPGRQSLWVISAV